MSAKRFGAVLLAANAASKLMKAKAGYDTTVTIVFCNQSSTLANVSLAYAADPQDDCTIDDAEYLVFEMPLPSHGVYEMRGVAVEADHHLIVRSTVANVSVVAFGFEEEAQWR